MSNSLRPHGLWPTRLLHPRDFPGKGTGVGGHFLLQGIFMTQRLNPGLLHCRQTLYHLSHQGSWFIHRCEWGIKISHYYCVTVNFPLLCYCEFPLSYFLAFALHICIASKLGAYIFVMVISSSWIEPLIIM